MLTKGLLKYRVRAAKVHPGYVDARDPKLLAQATEVIELYQAHVGSSRGTLEQAVQEQLTFELAPALAKLLDARVSDEEDDPSIEASRWLSFEASQRLRGERSFSSAEEFLAALGAELDRDPEVIKAQLYQDLPARRIIAEFRGLTPEQLLDRYNVALVQGLLLHARKVTVAIKGASAGQLRHIFRQLRFHRLMSEVESETESGMRIQLSGPLSLFTNAQSYGIRIANFIPHILHLDSWHLSAELKIKNKQAALEVTPKHNLRSHYTRQRVYVPEEFTQVLEEFNSGSSDWQLEACRDFIDLGNGARCFPDFTAIGPGEELIHIELFHRWHKGQLESRLAQLYEASEKNSDRERFRVGVCKSIANDPKIKIKLSESRWFKENGFTFSEFPTPKKLRSTLSQQSRKVANRGAGSGDEDATQLSLFD